MAEEWGEIVIKASDSIASVFERDNFNAALKQLADYADINAKSIDTSNATVDEIEIKANYIYLSYDCSEWVNLSNSFVSSAQNIEYFSRHTDEYGTLAFFALTADGEKLAFQFDQDGDAMEDESYQEEMKNKLNEWKSMIPDNVKQAFPSFADIKAAEYIY